MSQFRQPSPQSISDFQNNMGINLSNVRDMKMSDLSHQPDKTEAANSEELQEMMTTLEKKIYDFSDIKLRVQ